MAVGGLVIGGNERARGRAFAFQDGAPESESWNEDFRWKGLVVVGRQVPVLIDATGRDDDGDDQASSSPSLPRRRRGTRLRHSPGRS